MTIRAAVDDILALGPCPGYTRERVTELWGGRESLTHHEIAALEIPVADRLWALLHLAPDRLAWSLACDYSERALTREREAGREPDPRSWAAVDTRRRWLRGETTDEDLAAAWAAARAAAWAAVRADAGAAVRAAAWAAAWAAVRAAAGAAARAAAHYASGAAVGAAWAAERDWQLQHALDAIDAWEGE